METLFGWEDLLDYGLYIRAIIITLYAILLFRTTSSRLFGQHSALDFIIFIILGAILGEAIVNNIPMLPSMIACALIVIIHRFLAFLTYRNHRIGKYIKGEKVCLIKNGRFVQKNLRCCRITRNDIEQALRLQHGTQKLNQIKEAILERGGQISFILKNSP
ncbi:DUF421 domain-containing protein [Legionella taurinensis]|uniref:DUF421 domain-containing protein n=1 Tax=Legionella taurinensis TaxID=70611 RepID=A0A3A5LLN0_9GAMM|nr:YetF domain-containing protein [Legionella taurinensis]MDX1836571.1 DUF421 domain-containing protein [Legionella taurinensis]PUT42967.1 DUF421 domain-containing protein [Legionella taurinensis]PUT45522.1 DUF421 domain-containing protein [Legionella taurinensis]PUT46903.1 DUF421 domain-containing protein [Legionella taurinensis]PUT49289.1 DUF421 domain-containing protein [Legionella taurinensis]